MSRFYTHFSMHMGQVLLREVVDGKHVNSRMRIKPKLYLRSIDGADATHRTIHGEPVYEKQFSGVGEARRYLESHEDVHGFPVYGSTSWAYTAMNERYPGEVEFNPEQICVCYIDIEVKSDEGFPEPAKAEKEITSIAMSIDGFMHVFSGVDYPKVLDKMVYHKCDDEPELLTKFIETWNSYPIDVVVGWNIHFFDMPYIVNRLNRVLGTGTANLLSPWGMIKSRETLYHNEKVDVWSIVGITIVDYMDAYKKFRHKPQEFYSLDHISSVELDEKKLDYSEYASLHELYKHDPVKFIDYNVKDVRLMERLDKKLGFLNLIYTIAYYCKITYDDCFGTVKMWEALIHNDLISRNIVVPPRKHAQKEHFDGGYVKEVQTGRHDWIASFDFDSLYPHIIMALNISPETIVGQIPRLSVDEILDGKLDQYREQIGDRCVTGSCHLYDRTKQGFFPRIMEHLYEQRQEHRKTSRRIKKEMQDETDPAKKKVMEAEMTRYHNLQLAMKYALNSGYGAMSNVYFLWFDMRMAESVTLSGQVATRWVANDLNAYLAKITGINTDFVVASDTDSVYVRFAELVKKYVIGKPATEIADFVDKVCSGKLQGIINDSASAWSTHLNAYPGKLKMKREKIAESAIWTAKKKYAMLVWYDEEVKYKEPEMSFTGLDVVTGKTPKVCRDRMRETIKKMLTDDEAGVQAYIKKFREEFETMRLEDIGYITSVSGIKLKTDKSGFPAKGATQQASAAITYNRLITELQLDTKYQEIKEDEKVRLILLKEPNTAKSSVIACTTVMPPEFGIEKYADRDAQFEKVYLKPMKQLLDVIGWQAMKKPSLASFF